MADPAHVDAILRDGAGRAREIAGQTMRDVRSIVGFIS
jgi:tryptophanyl-tRNA synthetase